jgi:hypothetical protein
LWSEFVLGRFRNLPDTIEGTLFGQSLEPGWYVEVVQSSAN